MRASLLAVLLLIALVLVVVLLILLALVLAAVLIVAVLHGVHPLSNSWVQTLFWTDGRRIIQPE